MKKENFSLLNIKDYNNELEKILAKKNFLWIQKSSFKHVL